MVYDTPVDMVRDSLASYKGKFGDSGPGKPGLPHSMLIEGLLIVQFYPFVTLFESVTSLVDNPSKKKYITLIQSSRISQANGRSP